MTNGIGKHTQKLILWAFILHTIWEFGQCLIFYDMWSWSLLKSTIWMWAAIFGDILIVLGLWGIVTKAVPSILPDSTYWNKYAILLGISFPAGIILEWIAIYLNLWQYTPGMPVVTFLNVDIGILPVLQITILPAMTVFLANKF